MKKVDNIVANNVCENVFFTKSPNYKAKNVAVHGLNNLQSSVRYLSCEQRSRQARGHGGGPADIRRCPCGRDVLVRPRHARPPRDKDPVSNITLAVGISLLICGVATSLLGVYGYLLKGGGQFYLGSAAISGLIVFWTGVSGVVAARRFTSCAAVRGFLVLSSLSLLASAGLIIIGHLGTRRHSGLLVDILGGGEVCLGVINVILLVIGMVASSCCRIAPSDLRRQRALLSGTGYP
ncbi:uncharacterized protein LOC119101574 [Pollicipes pollicipes]|uniref:uncharacterized protein LOC119101488 n=1 Tax=Pollicipes pollicipes TaxID=41117 RepID=UPI00188595DC|nr:uncharacterized protein LOC119101488 [Pollicipes pollicipes]XP_037080819.1 uncharacterized protein LOC119101574 [Pollicipes pollicipes]